MFFSSLAAMQTRITAGVCGCMMPGPEFRRIRYRRTPLTREFFRDFEHCFGQDPFGRDREKHISRSSDERWKRFDREVIRRGLDNSGFEDGYATRSLSEDGLAEAEEIAAEIMSNLQLALIEMQTVADMVSISSNGVRHERRFA